MMKKNEYKIDVAVLLIFFARDDHFKQVFEQVKIARPRVLFLYQDGPREGRKDDIEGIKKCREIAEDIDWDCEVHKFYQEKNMGCDPSEFIAQKWAFSIVDKCIVLEDDDVPSQSFFPFCKELLDRYENDERINMICGLNHNDVTEDIDDSYLFTTKGAIWGWASWRRVIDTWDSSYSILEDKKIIKKLRPQFCRVGELQKFYKTCIRHKESGKAYYESISAISRYVNRRVDIVPKYNMITNIGISGDATHAPSNIKLIPKCGQKLLFKKRYEIEFPLKHPKYIIRDIKYEKKMTSSLLKKACIKVEIFVRKLIYR